jgi:hypothetical protein
MHSELVERVPTGVCVRHGEYRCLSLWCNGFGGSGVWDRRSLATESSEWIWHDRGELGRDIVRVQRSEGGGEEVESESESETREDQTRPKIEELSRFWLLECAEGESTHGPPSLSKELFGGARQADDASAPERTR